MIKKYKSFKAQLLLAGFLVAFNYTSLNAQISAYSFSESTEAYTAVVGTNATATGDDGSQNGIPIGFSFNFDGTAYTTFSINTNGFIRLGANVAATSWTNNIGTGSAQNPLIAAFWDDNNRNTGSIQYALSGIAPNQILEIGWDNVNIGGGGSTSPTNFASFKIRLYETTNVIEIVYGSTLATAGALSASIGLSSAGGFQSVTPGATSTSSSAVVNNNITATTDLVGKKYIFAPPAICSGVPLAGTASAPTAACSGVNFNLSLTGYSSGVSGLTFQWQSSSDGVLFANIATATTATSSVSQTDTAFYQCIVTCTGSGLSDTSNVIQVTINPFYNCYCLPTNDGTSCITNVTVNTLNNSTAGCSAGNYSAQSATTNLVTATSYNLSVTCDASAIVSVWFDWNQNGIYEASEWYQPYTTGTTGTIAVNVPLAALPGNTGMRVRTRNSGNTNGAVDACLNMGSGETEDYVVNIIPATPCAGTPANSSTVSTQASVCSGVNFTLSLSSSYSNTGITYQWQSSSDGVSFADITGETASALTVSQTASTFYQCIVTCTNGGATIISTPLQVTMNSFINCYCSSNLTTNSNVIDIITNVSLTNSVGGNLTQASAAVAPNYVSYNNAPLNLFQSSINNTLAITMGTDGTQWSAAWVDWNQDGVFDVTENIALATAAAGGSATVTYTFAVPGAAALGNTRIRVRGGSDVAYTAAGACATTAFGETEDYLVNILALPANPPTPVQSIVAPTCSSGTDLSVPGSPLSGTEWYWQTVASGTSTTNPVNGPYTVFLNGTYYVRTLDTVNNVWSLGSDSVVVSNIPLAPLPPIPTAVSPSCLTTSITVAVAPAGTAYFWQGSTLNGTSIAQNASAPFTANATGTYYVSAYDSTTSCWSNTNGVAVVIDTYVPQAPVASADVSICPGTTSALVSAAAAGSGSQIVSFGTNLVSSGTGTATYTASIPALPAGAIITGTQLEIIGAATAGGSWRSEMRVALSGVITLAPTQLSTLGSSGTITPDPSITVANPSIAGGSVNLLLTETFDDTGNDATFTEIRLIINYTLPATTISWFNAASGGTSLGTVSPLETVGTSVLPNTTTAGIYTFYVQAISGSCTSVSRDSVAVIVNPLPSLTLNDTAVCTGSAYTINAQNAGSTYVWNTTETTQSISATLGGLYYVDITTAAGCVARDSMTLVLNSLPVVNLGVDVAFCAGDSITLDAGNTGMNYLWNNTSASTTQTINASQTGNYIAIVTNPATLCSNADTILVTVNANPVQNLGADTTQCAGTVTLNAGAGNNDYLWNDNSIAQTLIASASGTYSVLVTDSVTGCFSNDTVLVTINPLPIVNVGNDSAQCGGGVVLDAANVGATYLWNDSTTAQTLTATATGQYYVTVTNTFACSATDTVNITIKNLPLVDLGNDSTQCGGGIVLDAGAGSNDYLWSDNTTAQTLTVFVTGQYFVAVTDTVSGCIANDTINISLNQYPVVNLGADTTQCAGTIVLDADNTGAAFLWSNTAITQTTTITSSGQYSVAVTASGCTTNDTIVVTIHALPAVGLSPFTTPICNDLIAFTLTNGNPVGGVYSGSNVTGNTFNSVAAGVGSHPITYTVTDTNGCSNASTQNITVQSCTGIEEFNTYEVVVYPNPTNGVFTIAIKNANIDELIISVVDIQGKEVFGSRESNITADYNKQVNLEGLSKGMYYIKLSTGADVKIQKLIVQ